MLVQRTFAFTYFWFALVNKGWFILHRGHCIRLAIVHTQSLGALLMELLWSEHYEARDEVTAVLMHSGHHDTTWVGRKSKSFKCDALACNIAVSFRCVHTVKDGHRQGLRALIFFTTAVFRRSTLSSTLVFLASVIEHVTTNETK